MLLGPYTRLCEQRFGTLVAGFGEQHLVLLFVDAIVAGAVLVGLALEPRRDLVHAVIQFGGVFRLARNNQRRARFVDQDRIDFIDDRVVQLALIPFARRGGHVVAQVVETEFVIGAVRDIGSVRALLVRMVHLRQDHADRQAEKAVNPSHPFGISLGQVIVDRDDVHALARQRVQIGGQRRHQRFALAGAHFADLAVMQDDAADQLHVEVAHVQHALARLADHRECLGKQFVERLACGVALLEFRGLGPQCVVGECGDRGFERVDGADRVRVLAQQAFVAATEYFFEQA
jgi:hypothetical protein